jgi:hypothetical protein
METWRSVRHAASVLLLLVACSEARQGDQGAAGAAAGSGVSPAGARVAGPSGASVVVPPNAVSIKVDIRIQIASGGFPGLTADVKARSQVFAFLPHGQVFKTPARVHVPLLASGPTTNLRLLTAAPGGSWTSVVGARSLAGAFEADVEHFSFFVVVGDEAGRDGAAGDGAAVSDARGEVVPGQPDAGINITGPLVRRLVPGRAQLVGAHLTGCSHQPSSSERWCAFSLPGQTLGRTDLWAINLTRALAGNVTCDGNDPSCRRLTDDLWTGMPEQGPSHPTAHRFEGDTLIFHANAPSNLTLYRGRIYAWRPGWSEARQISSAQGVTCSGHLRSDVAVCIENITAEAVMPTQFDLSAGRIGASPLPMVARITPSRQNQASQWRSGFSANGDFFAYSTGGKTVQERETLSVMRSDDTAFLDRRTVVGSGLSRWQIARDGQRWYFLRNYNYSTEGDPAGTLVQADFPSGANETVVGSRVGAFLLLSDGTDADRGIGIYDTVTLGVGTFRILRDAGNPGTAVTIASKVASAVLSPDLRFTYFSTVFDDSTGHGDAWIARTDGTGRCALTTSPTTDSYGSPFLAHSGLVFWADRVDPDTGVGEGWRANPDGCTDKQKFADRVDFWFPARDSGLLYSDMGDGKLATLRTLKLGPDGAWPPSGSVIAQAQVARVYAVLAPDRDYVLFTPGPGTAEDGLYLFGPTGFAKP